MAKRDYYDILGVAKTASVDEVRKAHRKLALKYHPDRNRDNKQAETKFKEIQEAYDVLGDAEKRKQYDEFGHGGVGAGGPNGDPFEAARRAQQQAGRGHSQWRGGPGVSVDDFDLNSGDLGSIFDQVFGGRPGRGAARARGAGGRADGGLSRRADRTSNIPSRSRCCSRRAGVTLPLQIDRGGQVETIEVKIPAGVKDASRIRIKGKGEQAGGEPGDIYIIPHITPHPFFRREDLDIYLDLPLSMYEASLGAKVTVPTLEGQLTVTIPPGTSTGRKAATQGSWHRTCCRKGDQIVVIKVMVPKTLDDADKVAIEAIAKKHPMNPRADVGW